MSVATAGPVPEVLTPRWKFDNPYGPLESGQVLAVAGDRLVGNAGSTIFAIDLYTGREAAPSDEVQRPGFPYTLQSFAGSDPQVTAGGGNVFFMDGDQLVALQLADGQPLPGWRPPALAQVSSLSCVQGRVLAVHLDPGSGATLVSAFDAVTGAPAFPRQPLRLSAGSAGRVGFGHQALFFVAGGCLQAVNVDFGDRRWRYPQADADVTRLALDPACTPVATDTLVLVVGRELQAVDLVTGARLWSIASPGGTAVTWTTPAVDADGTTAIATNSAGEVLAIRLADGSVRWRAAVASPGAPVITDDGVTIPTDRGATLTRFRLDSAQPVAAYALPGRSSEQPAITANGTVFVTDDNGGVVARAFSHQPAAYFDGRVARIDVPADAKYDFGLDDFTVEAWVRSSEGGEIVSSHPTAGGEQDHGFRMNMTQRGEICVAVFEGNRRVSNRGKTRPTHAADGEWHHVALLRRDGEFVVLVDGLSLQVFMPAAPAGTLSIGGCNALAIGAYAFLQQVPGRPPVLATEAHFCGLLREVRIWDRALDVATVQNNRKVELTGREPRLLGLWALDDEYVPGEKMPELRNRVDRVPATFVQAASVPTDLALDKSAFPYLIHEVREQWPYAGTWGARGEDPIATPPATSSNGTMAFGTNNALYGVRRTDGHRLWDVDVSEGSSAPVADGPRFFFLSGEESLVSIDAATGASAPVAEFAGLVQSDVGPFAAPAVTAQYIAAASSSGAVWIEDRATGKVAKAKVGSAPLALRFAGSALVVLHGTGEARELTVLDAQSGAARGTVATAGETFCVGGNWLVYAQAGGIASVDLASIGTQRTAPLPGRVTGLAARADADLLVVGTDAGVVHGFTLATLAPRWLPPAVLPDGPAGTGRAVNDPAFDAAGHVFCTTRGGAAVVLDPDTGACLGQYFTAQPIVTAPALDAGTACFGCEDPQDPAAACDGALHSVVFGETGVLRLGVDVTGQPHGKPAYALVDAEQDACTLHLMDVTRSCIEAWVNLPELATAGGGVLGICPTQAGGFDLRLWLDADGTVHYTARSRGEAGWSALHATAPSTIADGRWHHVAVSRDGPDHAVLYVDGNPLSGLALDVGPADAPQHLVHGIKAFVGATASDDLQAERCFRGMVGEVRVWDTYLVAPEIAGRMHVKLRGDEPDLLAYWNFDQEAVHDGARNGHDGALVNPSGAPAWWLADLPFEHPAYPFITTSASIKSEEDGKPTEYELVLKVCRADGTGLPRQALQLWYVRHAPEEPDIVQVNGQPVRAVDAASETPDPDRMFTITTLGDGTARLVVASTEVGHGPALDLHTDFMPANERYHVTVLIDSQKLAPPVPPVLQAQAKLIQDYHYTTGNRIDETRHRSTWRVVLRAVNPDQSVRCAEPITLWAAGSVVVEVAGRSYGINADNSVDLVADPQGELAVVLQANELAAPALYARAGFMHRNDRIVVAPDQDAHAELAQVQGEAMTQPRVTNWKPGTPEAKPLLGKDYQGEHADKVASSVRTVMASTSRDAPPRVQGLRVQRLRAARLRGTADGLFGDMQPPLALPAADRIATLRTLADIPRKAPLNGDAFQDALGGSLGFVFECSGSAGTLRCERITDPDQLARERGVPTAPPQMLEGFFGDLWDDIKTAAEDAYATASKIVMSTGVGGLIDLAIHNIDGIVHSVVKTLSDAVNAVAGFFKTLALKLEQLIEFLRALFDWGEIIATHRVLHDVVRASVKVATRYARDGDGIRRCITGAADRRPPAPDDREESLAQAARAAPPESRSVLEHGDSVKGKMLQQKSRESPPRSVPAGNEGTTPPDRSMGGLDTMVMGLPALATQIFDMGPSAVASRMHDLFVGDSPARLNAIADVLVLELRLAADAVDEAMALLDGEIDIPFVSELYRWITGSPLTLLDLACLGLAVPVHVAYTVTTAAMGHTRRFADDAAGLAASILAGPGLLALADAGGPVHAPEAPMRAAPVLGAGQPPTRRTTLYGEIPYAIVRAVNVGFQFGADELFSEAVATGGLNQEGLEKTSKARGIMKVIKGVAGIAATALQSSVTVMDLLERVEESVGEEHYKEFADWSYWTGYSLGLAAMLGADIVGILGGRNDIVAIHGVNAAGDKNEAYALLGVAGACGLALSYRTADMFISTKELEKWGADENVVEQLRWLALRDMTTLCTKLFSWMYTEWAREGLGGEMRSGVYQAVTGARLAGGLFALSAHCTAVFHYGMRP